MKVRNSLNSANTMPKLKGDERRFQQVMINLVKNAIKFTNKGKIQIKACYNRETGLLIVHVRDTGIGITSEDIPTLFSRFGKLQRTAALNNDGIGLGLMIVKQIIEQSGGSICVESNGVDTGSLFIFSMKLAEINSANKVSYTSNSTRKESKLISLK